MFKNEGGGSKPVWTMLKKTDDLAREKVPKQSSEPGKWDYGMYTCRLMYFVPIKVTWSFPGGVSKILRRFTTIDRDWTRFFKVFILDVMGEVRLQPPSQAKITKQEILRFDAALRLSFRLFWIVSIVSEIISQPKECWVEFPFIVSYIRHHCALPHFKCVPNLLLSLT